MEEDLVKKASIWIWPVEKNAGIKSGIHFQCPFTASCQNEQCFWKQRDYYKRPPFIYYPMEKYMEDNAKIDAEHGKAYFPEWKAFRGTNCMTLYCPDYKEKNEEDLPLSSL